MPSFHCRMIFISAVLCSIKVIVLTVTRARTHRQSVNDSVMYLNPINWLQLSQSSDTENATRLSSKEEQNL